MTSLSPLVQQRNENFFQFEIRDSSLFNMSNIAKSVGLNLGLDGGQIELKLQISHRAVLHQIGRAFEVSVFSENIIIIIIISPLTASIVMGWA